MKLIKKHPALSVYFLGVWLVALSAEDPSSMLCILGIGLIVGAVCIAIGDGAFDLTENHGPL